MLDVCWSDKFINCYSTNGDSGWPWPHTIHSTLVRQQWATAIQFALIIESLWIGRAKSISIYIYFATGNWATGEQQHNMHHALRSIEHENTTCKYGCVYWLWLDKTNRNIQIRFKLFHVTERFYKCNALYAILFYIRIGKRRTYICLIRAVIRYYLHVDINGWCNTWQIVDIADIPVNELTLWESTGNAVWLSAVS